MNTMIKKIILSVAIAVALSGCHSNNDPEPQNPTALVLMAAVYGINDGDVSVWHSGQPFGVYMLGSDNTPAAANAQHRADNRGATGYLVPDGAALCLPDDGKQVDIAAYYPYDESAQDNGHTTTITISEGMAPDAFLWARCNNADRNNHRITMKFKSQLAQIRMRILNDDPATARIVARIEGAPRSCRFDVINGCYIGSPACDSPIGVPVTVREGAFECSAVVAAAESAAGGPVLQITALDNSGKEIRRYPPIPLGNMLELADGRTFKANTVYNLAGNLTAEDVKLQFTGASPICILSWDTDSNEEFGTIIK